jgi:hypothetical protein
MQIASFVYKGVRIDLPIDKGWTPEARQASAEARQKDKTSQWSSVEKPVSGSTRAGNWLYQRLLTNVKRKQNA